MQQIDELDLDEVVLVCWVINTLIVYFIWQEDLTHTTSGNI